MPFELMVGPPASGKTTRLVERARSAALAGRRVWWVGLPNQRTYVYRRATEAGGVLGLEFLTVQQVAYRLLADALRLEPLVVGTSRLVLVGEALLATDRAIPSPGEARLFAYAIAEAKRFSVGPSDIPVHDLASERLRSVFEAYERLKGEHWDYDDFRAQALALAEEGTHGIEADLIVVDGFREVGPVDLRLYRALGHSAEVVLALPEAPPGTVPDAVSEDDVRDGVRDDARADVRAGQDGPSRVACYRAKNPVAEARWVLRSLKRDLARGIDPLDLAVVLPSGRTPAFAALADEYGVPTMDETPTSLADTPAGRRLTDLLALPDAPTAGRLLAIPELEPIAQAVLEQGVAGLEAVGVLADRIGLAWLWTEWRSRLAPEEGSGRPEMGWAGDLVDLAVAAEPEPAKAEVFRAQALRRAKEASALATGERFREWWSALLGEADLHESPRGGVALLDATRASGRRFERAYLTGAVAGAYRPGLSEDWFVPEEHRTTWEDVFENPAGGLLPRRFRGASQGFFRELLTRGSETIVTYPAADRDGPLEPEAELVTDPADLPEVPAGSRLELTDEGVYRAPRSPVDLEEPTVERLQRYAECGFRTWAEDVVANAARGPGGESDADPAVDPAVGSVSSPHGGEEADWWQALREDLVRVEELGPERLRVLQGAYPGAADWLEEHAETLAGLTFGVRLHGTPRDDADGAPWAELDAAKRENGVALIYRFAPPGAAETPAEAEAHLAGRWNEMWAAGRLLSGFGGKIERVHIRLWPVLGKEIDVFGDGIAYPWRRVERARQGVEAAYERFVAGDIEPRPGFICRSCVVADVCREGMR